MKVFFSLILLVLAWAAMAPAQEKKPRKTLTFQPGAKAPDEGAEAPKAVAASPAPSPVQAKATAADPKLDGPGQIAAKFFDLLSKNQIDEAYAALVQGSKIAERPDEVRNLKAKTTEAIQIFGEIHGFDLIDDKYVGSNLLRRTYISLGREFPLRWRFYFYRSDKQWRLVDLRVDDRLGGLFGEPEEPRTPETPP